MKNKYNLSQITKTLDNLFNAGFNTEKSILAIKLEDLVKIKDITSTEITIIIDLKKAIRNKKMIAFLSREEEKEKEESQTNGAI